MYRREVLSVYRQILRVAKDWKASSGRIKDTIEERNYIKDECKQLFRQNISLTENQEIATCLEEAKTRLELVIKSEFENFIKKNRTALHYHNPYPRPMNLPPLSIAQPGKTHLKAQQRARKQAKPIYLHSHKELD